MRTSILVCIVVALIATVLWLTPSALHEAARYAREAMFIRLFFGLAAVALIATLIARLR